MHAFKSAVTGVLLALSACPAFADNNPDGYWYLGGGGGVARQQSDQLGSLLGSSPNAVQSRPTGWKLFGGYRLNPFFGVELGYIDFGRISGQGTVAAAGGGTSATGGGDSSGTGLPTAGDPGTGTDPAAGGTADTSADPTAASDPTAVSSNSVLRRNAAADAGPQQAHAVSHSKGLQLVGVGYLPLNAYFDLFGKFGAFTSTTHINVSTPDGTNSDSKTRTDLTWGLGAQVYFNNYLSARVEWEHFRNIGKGVMETAAGTPVDLTAMSLIWNF